MTKKHTLQDSMDDLRALEKHDREYYELHGHRWYEDCGDYCKVPLTVELTRDELTLIYNALLSSPAPMADVLVFKIDKFLRGER